MNRIRETARRKFGYASLRPGQEEAISAVLNGRDTLVVMPTGSGKSAIYQIPAVLLGGPTVVVSPLIALQKDQAGCLEEHEVGGAAVVNSLISQNEQREALGDAEEGAVEFLFLAPEQFSNPERLAAIKAAKPSLFVVDEAHCISEWGHSFRPDYLRLNNVIEELEHPCVLALTATASADVRAEIIARLGMRNPKILVHGFDRPNIWLGVEAAASESKKHAMLLTRVQKAERPGIVYASTRKHAEEIKDELNSLGIRSAFYHGGLNKTTRESMQEEFMTGSVDVIVATSAFGMGIDKANVRFVFHYEPPDSLDSYYQEMGRAGRDGDPAEAVLFYRSQDLGLHKFFKGGGQVKVEEVQRILDALIAEGSIDYESLRAITKLSKIKLARALNRLEECGAVRLKPQGAIDLATNDPAALTGKAADAVQAQSERHQAELDRIEKIREYAENLNCRRAYLLRYFGEAAGLNCGNCDNCQGTGTERAQLIAETRARVGEAAVSTPGS